MDIIANKKEKLEKLIESAKQFDEKTQEIIKGITAFAEYCDKDFGDKSLNAIAKQYLRRALLALKAFSGKMRNVNGGND